jgi:hypothetical protein
MQLSNILFPNTRFFATWRILKPLIFLGFTASASGAKWEMKNVRWLTTFGGNQGVVQVFVAVVNYSY